MSTLQVSNVHFESTANNRIEYAGSNTVNIYAGGTNVLSANSSTMNIPVAGSISIGNSTVNTAITSTGISQNGDNLSPVSGMRNKIINGNFDIWQRATSFTSSGYGGADRWIVDFIGSSHTTSRQSFTLGQTDVPGEPTYYQRTVVTSSAGAGNYCITYQKIESVRTLAGQKATLSFWAKADATKNIAVEFTQFFGSGGSPSSSITGIDVTTCALTTSWQKFEVTVDIPSISGKTLGTTDDGYMRILFWLDAGSDYNTRTNSLGQQSGTFDIAQVQLEAGPVATPFEHRLPGVELSLCQRYYQKYTQPPLRGVFSSGSDASRIGMVLPVHMRSAPTTTMGALPIWDGAATSTISSVSASYLSSSVVEYSVSCSSSPFTVGRAAVVYQSGTESLQLSAEL